MALPPRVPGRQPPPRPALTAPQPPRAPAPTQPPDVSRVNWGNRRMTQRLADRGRESYRTKDGTGYKGILDEDKVRDIPLGKIAAGKHLWSIIPYICGEQDPLVYAGKLQAGADPSYTVGIYVHKNVGPNKARYICLARTYGLPCPICEYRDELDRDPEAEKKLGMSSDQFDKYLKSMYGGKYMTYLYYVWDRNQESKGLQIYEVSGFFLERELQAQAYSEVGGGYITFMAPGATKLVDGTDNPDGGREVAFQVTMTKTEQGQGQDWTGIKFEPRRYDIPAHILNQALDYGPLDMLLHVPSYEEVYEAFHQGQTSFGQDKEREEIAPPPAQHYECFRTGQCGGFQDCTATCPDYDECAKAGMVLGYPAGVQEGDIPSDPVHRPQPELVPEPAAAETQLPLPAQPRSLPPRGGGAPVGSNKPPLLRRGQ